MEDAPAEKIPEGVPEAPEAASGAVPAEKPALSEFRRVLGKIRKNADSKAERGAGFEELTRRWLLSDPAYAPQIDTVWRWRDFPQRRQFSAAGHDTGIDLVVLCKNGDYWAVQCKLFRANARMNKGDADSFLSLSGKSFCVGGGKERVFAFRLWVATSNNFGREFEATIRNQTPPVGCVTLADLEKAPVDWEKIYAGTVGARARQKPKKPRNHQSEAIDAAHKYFADAAHTRGKLIMACGTGKTFTSLKIAENEIGGNGLVLYFVPSIALVGQTLREWTANSAHDIAAVCVCSDAEVSRAKRRDEDARFDEIVSLAQPATTVPEEIADRIAEARRGNAFTVVFSTYQSSLAVSDAQEKLRERGVPADFDLMVCDEAHRTTGVLPKGDKKSIHCNEFITAKKRIYMTATPRFYEESAKASASKNGITLWSMDDEATYGEEFYRIGFGRAVEEHLLSDYKVLVLTVPECAVSRAVQEQLAEQGAGEIPAEDFSKYVGCINALSKQMLMNGELLKSSDPDPMRSAVAFCQNIKISKITAAQLDDFEDILDKSAALALTVPDENDDASATVPAPKTVRISSREARKNLVRIEARHVDGTMGAGEREERLAWLKGENLDDDAVPADVSVAAPQPTVPAAAAADTRRRCRILCNVRCLSEGVDVPALDAVIFLSPRNSQIDVVQSVGRVMRRAPGKKYGYIIIPVIIPAGTEPEKVLSDNRFEVVWSVLRALRAHDDRFCAVVNQIRFNKNRPKTISVGTGTKIFGGNEDEKIELPVLVDGELEKILGRRFADFADKIYAEMVERVGERDYWETWARDVAKIAERHIAQIRRIVDVPADSVAVPENVAEDEAVAVPENVAEADTDARVRAHFAEFVAELRQNINPGIRENDVIEMLAQHLVTQPVFDALFKNHAFSQGNAISKSMTKMILELDRRNPASEADRKTLQRFYDSVRMRVEKIDNAAARQELVRELYETFFQSAFPQVVEKLGIVYTPIPVVDFIVRSVEVVLNREFGRSLADKNVFILDPFTGTGTFITRLLSFLHSEMHVPNEHLREKFLSEIYANEIVLLAYYIAGINIETVFAELAGTPDNWESFPGICLTDTFQLSETKHSFEATYFPENSERALRERDLPLRVIFGNPPYSVGQKSANDNAQNEHYAHLEARIAETYAAGTDATSKKALYDSYIKAFRWASDRIDAKNGGVVAFVTNAGWLDGNAMNGFRKCLVDEFSAVYVFDLRGNCRTSGELRRRESGNVFGGGSRTPIAITVLVKRGNDGAEKRAPAKIFYRDIGDYLSREAKLKILDEAQSIDFHDDGAWKTLEPDEHGDWLNKRSDAFAKLTPLEPEKKFDAGTRSVFTAMSNGVKTNRDAWCWNFSRERLEKNMRSTIDFYNSELARFEAARKENPSVKVADVINFDSTKISWDRQQKEKDLPHGKKYRFAGTSIRLGLYRPFQKSWLYFNREMNNCVYRIPLFFPTAKHKNLLICVSGRGVTKEFSCIITDIVPDLELIGKSQCFPLYFYEEAAKPDADELFDGNALGGNAGEVVVDGFVRRDGVSDFILKKIRDLCPGAKISKEDIFYYVYGVLHSASYREAFSADLKKMLPRLPLPPNAEFFRTFSEAGRELAALHLGYETAPLPRDIFVTKDGAFAGTTASARGGRVEKMRFDKGLKASDRPQRIWLNGAEYVGPVPAEAYDYVVNGKSAIEWMMERYAVTTHKESGIENDPNLWSEKPYIADLLCRVIDVSRRTVKIVNALPKLDFS